MSQEMHGMNPTLYYLYVYLLKYGWRVSSVSKSDDGPITIIVIRSSEAANTSRTIVLWPERKERDEEVSE